MNIQILASGSTGNAYHISDGQAPLLLEAGIPFTKIQEGINFKVSKLAGCLITHHHGDHGKAVKEVMKAGVDCYLSKGEAEALGVNGHRTHIVKALEQFTIGPWTILPFDVIHDTPEPLGFLLVNKSIKLLYATDTAYIKYRFKGLTHVLIEANHSLGLMQANVANGSFPLSHMVRVQKSHMSIETLVDFFKANDLSRVEEVHLLHLSNGNSDAEGFKRTIQGITGKVVRVY